MMKMNAKQLIRQVCEAVATQVQANQLFASLARKYGAKQDWPFYEFSSEDKVSS